jgi:hypothetical protein
VEAFACWSSARLDDPQALDSPCELVAVGPVSITEQVPRDRVVWECLDDLPGGPDARGVVRDVDMEEFAAVVAEHDEGEEEAVGEGGNEKEVDGDDGRECPRSDDLGTALTP